MKGTRLYATKASYKTKRISVIGVLNKNKLMAPCTFEGTCNNELFTQYVENILLPELKAGNVLVLDNASFHKSKKVKEIIESKGIKLMFLPPYSPDLNPIEHAWAKIKNTVKKFCKYFYNNFNDVINFAINSY